MTVENLNWGKKRNNKTLINRENLVVYLGERSGHRQKELTEYDVDLTLHIWGLKCITRMHKQTQKVDTFGNDGNISTKRRSETHFRYK